MSLTLKSNFAVTSKHEAFYTSGKIQVSRDGLHILCGCGNKVNVMNVHTGCKEHEIGQDDDPDVTSFVLSPDEEFVVVALQNLVLKQWRWKDQTLVRSWKAIHTAPILTMTFDTTSTLVATGSSDSTIKVWDVIQQYCTHNLRGHQGVVTVVRFHPDTSKLQLYTAAEDYKIRVWDLKTSSCIAILDKHYSVITSLEFTNNNTQLLSAGRDRVLILWELSSFEATKTVPVYEAVESVVLLSNPETMSQMSLPKSGQCCLTGGSKGMLRLWDLSSGKCVHEQTEAAVVKQPSAEEHDPAIIQAFIVATSGVVVVVTFDYNILLYHQADLSLSKQFCGYNDEILDLSYLGADDSHIVVATNSDQVKVFELATWNCHIARGHTDIVLCLQAVGDMFVTSSKDMSIRLWKFDPQAQKTVCVGVGLGHTSAVGSVTLSRLSRSFVVSGGQDFTVKLWSVPISAEETSLQAIATQKAHDKDINSVTVSPNDKLIATGSQDKTAKLWSASNLSLIGVMRGHRRAIWCVQFSPVDQCLATASADGIIKIWSLTDFSCVKTFEGHDASVLQVQFVSRGMQLLSSGSDGLVKLWTVKTNECVKTLDEHEDKAWALTVSRNEEQFITGGADSNIIVWKDVTDSELQEVQAKEEELIIKEQTLSNLLQQKKYIKALGLAITLEQPFRVLNIIKEISGESDSKDQLAPTIAKLRMDQIDAILRFAVQWNMNSRHCHVSQLVISIILQLYPADDLLGLPNIKASLEGLLPYTERHFHRMGRLLQNTSFIDYTWQCMKLSDRSVVTKVSTEMDADHKLSSVKLNGDGSPDSERLPSVDNGQGEAQVDSSVVQLVVTEQIVGEERDDCGEGGVVREKRRLSENSKDLGLLKTEKSSRKGKRRKSSTK